MTRGIYALDLGNGDMKIMSLGKDPVVYPSVVGQIGSYTAIDLGKSGSAIDNMSLKKDGKEYAIGNMALKNSSIRSHDTTADKYMSMDIVLLSDTAFSLLSDATFSIGNVVIGLPLYKMPVAKDVVRFFQGKRFGGNIGFYGEHDGKVKNVQLDKEVVAVAQPHGTLFNLILDSKGAIENKELAKSGIAVFDIGYKTNDGIVFKNLEPVGRLTIQSKNGMFVAYEQIRQGISSAFKGLEVKQFEIPQIIKSGTVKGSSVESIINDAFYDLASNIILEINSTWSDAWEVENIVFTGGGAELLKPYLMQAYYNCIFPSNCQTSNVEGMMKYATRLWGRG